MDLDRANAFQQQREFVPGVTHEPATDSVKLLNDAGAVWLSAPRGSATTLQNAQCSIAVSGVTKSAAGNVLTLNVPVTFSASYAGSKNIYLFAAGSTVNSGWQDRGDWTIPAPPAGGVTAVSASPSSGSGSAGTFALQFNDALGAADLKTAWAWFTTTNSSSSANSCLVYYDQTADTVNLLNDAATVWSWAARGSANTLQNSQCSVAVAGVTKVPAGNVMTVTIPVTFSGAYAGVKNIYLFAAGSTLNSGWQDRGDWTVPAGAPAPAVTADSVTPGSGSGSSATFALKYSSSLGASDLQAGWVWFSTSASSSSANSCLAYYEPPTDTLYLLNDAGTAWMSAKRGSTGSLRNSRCTISVAGATRSVSGNTLTLNLPVTFSGLFTGTKNIYLFGTGSSLNSGWQDRGDWTVP